MPVRIAIVFLNGFFLNGIEYVSIEIAVICLFALFRQKTSLLFY